MIIVGGGVIGMEFAFILANLDVEVTVIEYFEDILAALDDDVCEEITKIAAEKGIKLYTGSKVESIFESEDDKCIVAFSKDGNTRYVTADKVLMAVGRQPYLEDIGIEKIGIELNDNKRGIKVNEKMQTNVENIYAIGDVTNIIQLAHVASHQGIVAVKNILGQDTDMNYDVVPSAIFTTPEIGMVGMSEKEAIKKGIDIKIGKFPFAANGKALTLGERKGFVKLIKDNKTNKVIGGTIIGPHATDLIAEVALAVKNGLTAEAIAETIHAHPTTAESLHEASLALEGGALHFAE
jgi:dihydrolipoamide dehydrogenase